MVDIDRAVDDGSGDLLVDMENLDPDLEARWWVPRTPSPSLVQPTICRAVMDAISLCRTGHSDWPRGQSG